MKSINFTSYDINIPFKPITATLPFSPPDLPPVLSSPLLPQLSLAERKVYDLQRSFLIRKEKY